MKVVEHMYIQVISNLILNAASWSLSVCDKTCLIQVCTYLILEISLRMRGELTYTLLPSCNLCKRPLNTGLKWSSGHFNTAHLRLFAVIIDIILQLTLHKYDPSEVVRRKFKAMECEINLLYLSWSKAATGIHFLVLLDKVCTSTWHKSCLLKVYN